MRRNETLVLLINLFLLQIMASLHVLCWALIFVLKSRFPPGSSFATILQIQDYYLFQKDRVGKKGGGILAYVNNRLHAKIRPDLMENETEVLWLEVCPFKSNCLLLVAGVYRPPLSNSQDDIKIGKNFENAYLLNKEMILLGDFNVDSLNANQFNKHKLIKTLKNLHLTEIVNEVTRPLSGTGLDHIWTSHPNRIKSVRVKDVGMSDNLPTVAV